MLINYLINSRKQKIQRLRNERELTAGKIALEHARVKARMPAKTDSVTGSLVAGFFAGCISAWAKENVQAPDSLKSLPWHEIGAVLGERILEE